MMQKKQNLLLVFSDQHRWCDLGCYGNPDVLSPNLDAFARDGLRFDSAYTNCPLCVPARGTLLTGLHALKHQALANDLPIASGLESIGTRLKAAGYRTGYIGKWHLAGVPRKQCIRPEDRMGFDYWKVRQCSHDYLHPEYHDEENRLHVCEGYEPVVQTDLALEFLREQSREPWGLVLSWGPPHDPYRDAPGEFLELFDPSTLRLRQNVPAELRPMPRFGLDEPGLRSCLAGYYAHIAALDAQFGRIVQHLKESGQWENTLVVYTSDHGDLLGSHNMILKQLPYEESVHIPLLVGGGAEGLRTGSCDELIGLVDLAPTLLNWLRIDCGGSGMDGADLSALLADPRAAGLSEVYLYSLVPCHYGEDRGDPSWRALRTREHTYVVNADTAEDWLLFDNTRDPFQRTNLLGTRHQIDLESLRRRLNAHAERHDSMLAWQALLKRAGLVAAWNRSQRHFKRAELVG